MGSFNPELNLNRLRQICIIAQLIDDPCCGKGRFGGNLSDIAGVEQQPVVGNLTTGLQGGGELGDSDSAVLSIDIALHVIGVNDEKIEHFISISVLNDWTDSIGIDDLLHYGGDYHGAGSTATGLTGSTTIGTSTTGAGSGAGTAGGGAGAGTGSTTAGGIGSTRAVAQLASENANNVTSKAVKIVLENVSRFSSS